MGLGHEYIDTHVATADIAAKFIQEIFDKEILERKNEDDHKFAKIMAEHSKQLKLESQNCPPTLTNPHLNRRASPTGIL